VRPEPVPASVPAAAAGLPPEPHTARPVGEAAVDPSTDAHLRRALALVELSRLALDAD
jgi:hypothetical protein